MILCVSPNNCNQLFYMKASSLIDVSLVHSFLIAFSFNICPVTKLLSACRTTHNCGFERVEQRTRDLCLILCSRIWGKDWRTKAVPCLQLLRILFFFCFLESLFLNASNNISLGMSKLTLFVTSDYFV